jgi:hypothetical protein
VSQREGPVNLISSSGLHVPGQLFNSRLRVQVELSSKCNLGAIAGTGTGKAGAAWQISGIQSQKISDWLLINRIDWTGQISCQFRSQKPLTVSVLFQYHAPAELNKHVVPIFVRH